MHKIYILMGKSATGKDTIFKKMVENQEPVFGTVVSYTTRPIRSEETDGVEYYFVGEEQLEALQTAGKVIEHRAYDTVHGIWHYFTVDDGQIDLTKTDYLLIGTLKSYEQIKKFYGADKVCPIYIEVEDGIRLERALFREKKQASPKYAELCRRFLADEEDFREENLNALAIHKKYNNTDSERCIREIIRDIQEKTTM